MRLVEVEWIDAIGEDGELEMEAAMQLEPVKRKQAGFLIVEDEGKVNIIFGTYPNLIHGKDVADKTLSIPRCTVLSIREIKGIEGHVR